MSDATERATELGTQHGKAAGEAWAAENFPTAAKAHAREAFSVSSDWARAVLHLPEPDLSGDYSARQLAQDVGYFTDGTPTSSERTAEMCDTYCAAFRAAVADTIRAATGSNPTGS